MAFQFTINGVDYTAPLEKSGIQISEALQVRGFSLSCTLLIQNQNFDKPLAGQWVILTRDGVKEFAGRIATVKEEQAGSPLNYWYQLQCVDGTTDFDSTLINEVFSSQLAGDIVRVVIGRIGRGFTSNNVEDAIPVNELRVDLEPPSSVIQKIADSIGYSWYIDYDRDIHFFQLLNRQAPIPEVDVDSDTDTYHSLVVTEQWEQVKNRIYLTGADVKSTNQQTEPFTGDGGTAFFPLGYQPFDYDSITVIVDAVSQTILRDGIDGKAGDGLGSAGQAYVCIDNWGVRFPDGLPPANGANIQIEYNYTYQPNIVVEDIDSIVAMKAREDTAAAPSTGVHELRFDIPDLRVTNEDSVVAYGQLLLLRYASIPYSVEFTTYVQGWHVGQNLRIFSAAGRRDFDRTFYVQGVRKSVRIAHGTPILEYTIEASTNPFPG